MFDRVLGVSGPGTFWIGFRMLLQPQEGFLSPGSGS